jgi:predicted nucleic acid-binding protein
MKGLTLDAGALIAYGRNDREAVAILRRARSHKKPIVIPAGVLGQVWRDGRRQVWLARLLATDEVEVEVLDDLRARSAGQLCGVKGSADVIDASVVLCARARGHKIVTSDRQDLKKLDSTIELIDV